MGFGEHREEPGTFGRRAASTAPERAGARAPRRSRRRLGWRDFVPVTDNEYILSGAALVATFIVIGLLLSVNLARVEYYLRYGEDAYREDFAEVVEAVPYDYRPLACKVFVYTALGKSLDGQQPQGWSRDMRRSAQALAATEREYDRLSLIASMHGC